MIRGLSNGGAYVKVGFIEEGPGGQEHSNGMSHGEIAMVHEFGSPTMNIPERPFVGPSIVENESTYVRMLTRLIKAVISSVRPLHGAALAAWKSGGMRPRTSMTLERALGLLGLQASTDIKKRVTQGEPISPPNAPSVAARKQRMGAGVVRTLVDTGRMIAAVSWAVFIGSSEKDRGP